MFGYLRLFWLSSSMFLHSKLRCIDAHRFAFIPCHAHFLRNIRPAKSNIKTRILMHFDAFCIIWLFLQCWALLGGALCGPVKDGSDSTESTAFRFLPWALGDGSRGQFRRCSAAMTSSMLEPNIPLLRRFVQLEEVTTVVERSEMATRRLDDLLPEIPGGGVESWHILAYGAQHGVLSRDF